MKRIFENLRENVSEACFEDIVNMVEEYINELKAPTKETAQAVVDRKVEQLKDSSAKMGAARDRFKKDMTFDGNAINGYGDGMVSKHTARSSSNHSETVKDGARLNSGALRIANSATKYGANVNNLKTTGLQHNLDVRKNMKDHHDIKHMHDN